MAKIIQVNLYLHPDLDICDADHTAESVVVVSKAERFVLNISVFHLLPMRHFNILESLHTTKVEFSQWIKTTTEFT